MQERDLAQLFIILQRSCLLSGRVAAADVRMDARINDLDAIRRIVLSVSHGIERKRIANLVRSHVMNTLLDHGRYLQVLRPIVVTILRRDHQPCA
ncbi:hypothetical protein XM57_25585 [Burkholderia cepacia]|nr:hypothetical protein XM57_25585 [Burkholderia cepacia]ETP63731.1 hypothetical protein BDSB_19650 [Burkholderia dolosa PC543]